MAEAAKKKSATAAKPAKSTQATKGKPGTGKAAQSKKWIHYHSFSWNSGTGDIDTIVSPDIHRYDNPLHRLHGISSVLRYGSFHAGVFFCHVADISRVYRILSMTVRDHDPVFLAGG